MAGDEDWEAFEPRIQTAFEVERILETFRCANTHPIDCGCRTCILCRYIWEKRRRGWEANAL